MILDSQLRGWYSFGGFDVDLERLPLARPKARQAFKCHQSGETAAACRFVPKARPGRDIPGLARPFDGVFQALQRPGAIVVC